MSRLTQMARGLKTHGAPGRTGGILGKARGIAGRFTSRGRTRGLRGRRGHGISKTELRGFRKVIGLLRKVGMVPKGTRRAAPVRRT